MKLLRRKFYARTFSVFGILLVLNNLIYPNLSYALTSGPHQPEFTSYEEASASDMVNLATGDFTFNLPVLSVPIGDEGGFSVPLSYHAGIGPEQEASWVGLGWNINVGSITRGINGFPDDANSDSQTVTVQDLTGSRGWNANLLGSMLGWDSQKGNYGVIDLSLGFGTATVEFDKNGISSIGIVGLHISDGGVSFDGRQFMMFVIRAAMAAITDGASEELAGRAAIGLAVDAVTPVATPTIGTNGYWNYTKETKKHLFYTDYWIWLDQSRVESMYGTLNLDKAPSVPNTDLQDYLSLKENINSSPVTLNQFNVTTTNYNKGAASDITTDLATTTNTGNYWDNTNPALLAYDDFNVNGPGISGGIKPYRLEVGSVSVPRDMSANHVRLNPVPYLDYGSTKVPFVYEGAMGNSYYNHVGAASTSVKSPAFYFGLDANRVTTNLQYDINDVTMDNQRIRSDIATNKKLPQGHFVDWLTNRETNVSGAYSNTAYMDYYKPADRNAARTSFGFPAGESFSSIPAGCIGGWLPSFTSNITSKVSVDDRVDVTVNQWDNTNELNPVLVSTYTYHNITVTDVGVNTIKVLGIPDLYNSSTTVYEFDVQSHNPTTIPDTNIGGFVITDPSGMNYHFAIPVYDYNFHTETTNKSDATKRNMISRKAAFANTWLLTAITGPDFVDRGGANGTGDGYIDENDWGYWVKFNYNRASTNNQWSLPFNKQKATSDNGYYSYASGCKEKYFLNSIETRSHVALFLQGSRSDGYDAYGVGGTQAPRLTEIDLITKDTYKTLVSKYHMPDASGSRTVKYNPTTFSSYLYNYLRASAIKRIIFNQDYSLCNGVPTSTQGKLTLKSLSICGQYDSAAVNSNKVFPDYKFDYANNPTWNADKWDGWGMYSSIALADGTKHQSSPVDNDGSAWSLTKITNPEGSEIQVAYERDTYQSISGVNFPTSDNVTIANLKTLTAPQALYSFNVGDASHLKIGDYVSLYGTVTFSQCLDGTTPTPVQVNMGGKITSISGSVVTLDSPYYDPTGTGLPCPLANGFSLDVSLSGSLIPSLKRGGNIRVSSLTLNDPGGQSYKTRYLYSGGVVSEEPDYIKTSEMPFYNYLNYAATPVLYGQVSVLSGKLTTDSDYNTKQVYNFITPDISQYTINTTKVKDKALLRAYAPPPSRAFPDYQTLVKHEITRHTNKLGKITSTATYDAANTITPVLQTNYYYTENPTNSGVYNYQGLFSEGTLLFEAIIDNSSFNRYHRAQRTTSITYPFALQKVVTTTSDGFTTINENKDWDKMTGSVLEKWSTSPLGVITQQVNVPAYTLTSIYGEFDSKAKSPANKNMLTQTAANYTYRLDNFGNQIGLISASATTYLKAWQKYRSLDAATNNYTNSADQYPSQQVWRVNQNYVWKGNYARLQSDGTQSFAATDKFDFSAGAVNSGWQMVGSNERYDHFSTLLEAKDMNGIYSSSKKGYNELFTLASASNANYEEIAFSSAEDQIGSGPQAYFGGEVNQGSGAVVSSPVHTGTKALSLSSGYGFIFKSFGLNPSKSYRACVWANSSDGAIYYKSNGGGEVVPVGTVKTRVGNWYKIDATVPAGSSSIEIGVKSLTGATIVFDDFRFQPMQSAMTAYVYDPTTRNLTHSLDNDNLYTRFYYNKKGQLTQTYAESIKYNGERLILEKKNDYKRNYTNP